jgi:hypothetical protein
MAEALAALAVLALAMGQVSEVLFRYVGATKATNSSVATTRAVLADFNRIITATLQEGDARDSAPERIVIDGQVFRFETSCAPPAEPCLFDAVGRRCR